MQYAKDERERERQTDRKTDRERETEREREGRGGSLTYHEEWGPSCSNCHISLHASDASRGPNDPHVSYELQFYLKLVLLSCVISSETVQKYARN